MLIFKKPFKICRHAFCFLVETKVQLITILCSVSLLERNQGLHDRSSQGWHASQASSRDSCPSPTSPPLRDSTVPSLQASCFLSQVSHISGGANILSTHSLTSTSHPLILFPALFVLLAMAIYTGVTVNFLGRRFGDWRFSWSYILGWVAMLMNFFAGTNPISSPVNSSYMCVWQSLTCIGLHFCSVCVAGIFYICAYRMCECRRGTGPR